jgi:hypothetical protein
MITTRIVQSKGTAMQSKALYGQWFHNPGRDAANSHQLSNGEFDH